MGVGEWGRLDQRPSLRSTRHRPLTPHVLAAVETPKPQPRRRAQCVQREVVRRVPLAAKRRQLGARKVVGQGLKVALLGRERKVL